MNRRAILECGIPGVDYIPGVRQDLFGVGAAVQGGASIAGSALQASAINNATAAQEREANNALNFQQTVYGNEQQAIAPYQQAGQNALGQLATGTGFSSGVTPGSFTSPVNYTPWGGSQGFTGEYDPIWADKAPAQIQPNFSFTGKDLQNDPGYQFTLNQGLQALQRNEAATGNLGGGAAKEALSYGTGLADQTFNQAYQRALGTAQQNSAQQNTNFNQYLGQNAQLNQQQLGMFNTQLQNYNVNNANQLNYYNAAQQNQANAFNRLSALAGTGQTATQQLSSAGQNAANGISNLYGQLGNAQSAGAIAGGQAISNGINGAAGAVGNYLNYKSIYG